MLPRRLRIALVAGAAVADLLWRVSALTLLAVMLPLWAYAADLLPEEIRVGTRGVLLAGALALGLWFGEGSRPMMLAALAAYALYGEWAGPRIWTLLALPAAALAPLAVRGQAGWLMGVALLSVPLWAAAVGAWLERYRAGGAPRARAVAWVLAGGLLLSAAVGGLFYSDLITVREAYLTSYRLSWEGYQDPSLSGAGLAAVARSTWGFQDTAPLVLPQSGVWRATAEAWAAEVAMGGVGEAKTAGQRRGLLAALRALAQAESQPGLTAQGARRIALAFRARVWRIDDSLALTPPSP